MGFVRKHTGIDLTGGGASDAAGDAARRQEGAAREGLAALRADLDPFRQVGANAAGQLMGSVYSPTQQDPRQILNDPFFKAMADQQNNELLQSRAALGLGSSGGTQDILMRNLLLLGRGFQQENLNNALNQNQQRFGQLFNTAQMGQNAAAQTGSNTLQTMNNIGQIQSVPGMINAQVKAQQGQQLMGLLGTGASMFGPGLMSGGAISPGMAGGGMAGLGAGSAVGGAGMGMMPGMGGAGAMAGGLSSGIQGALMAGMMSDKALKTDIEKVGQDDHGNIYHFRYTFDPDKRLFKGRMAQELKEIRPDAVSVHPSGYLQVSAEFMAHEVA